MRVIGDITRARALAIAMCALTGIHSAQVQGTDFSAITPEKAGFSSERLNRLEALMLQAVAEKQYGGVVVLFGEAWESCPIRVIRQARWN
jgi:hypothetical protein